MSELLKGLNERQVEAVTTTEGYIRVVAGAGTGKTRALTHRFAYLVNELGVLPSNILCVTFTNKSANEMRQRIRKLTGDNDTGYICTFHSFCVSVLQEEAHAVQYPESFIVLDNSDINQMLSIIYEERGLTLRHMTYSAARDMIEIRKCINDPLYFMDMLDMSIEQLKEKYDAAQSPRDIIFYGYLYQEKKCFGLDYNDLIIFTLHIFEQDKAIREKWRERLEYIMIDEFQDIDELQYRLMRAICGHHNNLFIVGDPDQTIYTWRGASVRFLLDFPNEFPNVRTINMLLNYRSTPQIIAAANSLIERNKQRIKKELIPSLPKGEKPEYYHARSMGEEALWIAGRIKELEQQGAKLSDIAMLYRSHFVSRAIEEAFLAEKLPYTLYSGVQFFDRAEIKDALSYLRLIAFRDDLSFMRVVNTPKRNIGERRMAFLRQYARENNCSLYKALAACAQDELFRSTKARAFLDMIDDFVSRYEQMPISELISAVLEQSGYERALRTAGDSDRLDNLAELKQSIYEYEIGCGEETTLESYLAHIALFTNADADDGKNAVKLMTVHSAKGLEFPFVFLCSLEESVFPSKKTATVEAMEEERRLAFVAMTRAERALFLSDSEGRGLDGSFRFPSRFIFDIDKALLNYINELDESLVSDASASIASSEKLLAMADYPRFVKGERVRHAIMGEGTVQGEDEQRAAYIIKFDILPTERKISMKTKLERIE